MIKIYLDSIDLKLLNKNVQESGMIKKGRSFLNKNSIKVFANPLFFGQVS